MSAVAWGVLGLLSRLKTQKRSRCVTLLMLSELWRGIKAKSHTQFFNLGTFTGYGKGKKYTKHEIDSVVHKMVFNKVLEDILVAIVLGLLADYVQYENNAQLVLTSTHR